MVRFQSWLRYSLILFVLALVSGCGGGSGGASSGGGSLSYTGATAPARITYLNAEELAISAFEGGASINAGAMSRGQLRPSSGLNPETRQSSLISSTTKRILGARKWTPSAASSAKFTVGSSAQGDASCAEGPGKADASITYYPDYTARAVITYTGYCSTGTRLTGSANGELFYDSQTLMLSELTLLFGWLRLDFSAGASMASGSIRVHGILESSYGETVNMLVQDAATLKTYKTEGLEIVNTSGLGYFDVSVTGGAFYHPDYGYVSMSTKSPVRYMIDSAQPYAGSFQAAGSSGSAAQLDFYPHDLYRVQADTRGDGSYEVDSGMKSWGGMFTAPTANAGVDQGGYAGHTVTLDGTGSVSRYGAPLTYAWALVSAPSGSAAALGNRDAAVTHFIPDVVGTYVFSLVVDDGYSESQADNVTVTVGYAPFFSAYQTVSVGSWAEAVAIGDLNGDGKNDVALITSWYDDPQNDRRVHVFLQNASGGLNSAIRYEVANGTPSSIAAGDVNNDGRADVVVGADTGVSIFLQSGSGSLVLSAFYPTLNARNLVLGDFNGDGKLDMASGGQGNTVEVRLQTVAGAFSAPATYTVDNGGQIMTDSGDLNNDGLDDLAVTYFSAAGRGLAVLLQNGSGAFDVPVYYWLDDRGGFADLAVGDINGDSRDDMVATNGWRKSLRVLLQNAQGGMEQQVGYPVSSHPEPVVISDVNRDGREDVVLLYSGSLNVFPQETGGQLGSVSWFAVPYASHYNPQGLAVGDVNGDGRKDVVIAHYGEGLVVLYNSY